MIHSLLLAEARWSVTLLLVVLSIIVLYGYALFQNRKNTSNPSEKSQSRIVKKEFLFFSMAMVFLYALYGTPLFAFRQLSFSFHMMHMSVFLFMIPPLLLLGMPLFWYQRMKSRQVIRKLGEFLSAEHALLAFSILLFVYHFPPIIGNISTYPLVDKGYMLGLFILSLRSWWPIVTPDKETRLTGPHLKRYLLKSGLWVMPACLFFIASAWLEDASHPLLAQLGEHVCLPEDMKEAAILPASFHTKYDQVAAGLAMMGLHKLALTVGARWGMSR